MRAEGDLYWEGLDTFRCVYLGLPPPLNRTSRNITRAHDYPFDDNYRIGEQLLLNWQINISCKQDYQFAYTENVPVLQRGEIKEELKKYSEIIHNSDTRQPSWDELPWRCEGMLCIR